MIHPRKLHYKIRRVRRIVLALAVALLAGCSTPLYRKLQVEQGSEMLPENLAKIEIGMTREEVSELLGRPQIRWLVDQEVWLYYYKSADEAGGGVEIYFNQDGYTDQIALQGIFDSNAPDA